MGVTMVFAPERLNKTADTSFYRPELDILRFCAFLVVFLSHALPKEVSYYVERGIPAWLASILVCVPISGSYGVDLFFCLSSYLITELLLREIATRGSLDVRAFYIRRILRIWPLYFVNTGVAVLLPYFDSQLQFGWKYALAFLFFSGNWIWALQLPVITPATPLWSISVEEQFYITWPLIIRRASPNAIKNIAIGLLVTSNLIRIFIRLGLWQVDVWHNTIARLDPIALGAIIAITLKGRSLSINRLQRLSLLALGIIAYVADAGSMDSNPHSTSMIFVFPLTAVACATILVSVVGLQFNRQSLLVKMLIYLGKISYGLYVFHSFSIYWVDLAWEHYQPAISPSIGFPIRVFFSLALTILLSAISYRWLESPFLALKSKFAHLKSEHSASLVSKDQQDQRHQSDQRDQ